METMLSVPPAMTSPRTSRPSDPLVLVWNRAPQVDFSDRAISSWSGFHVASSHEPDLNIPSALHLLLPTFSDLLRIQVASLFHKLRLSIVLNSTSTSFTSTSANSTTSSVSLFASVLFNVCRYLKVFLIMLSSSSFCFGVYCPGTCRSKNNTTSAGLSVPLVQRLPHRRLGEGLLLSWQTTLNWEKTHELNMSQLFVSLRYLYKSPITILSILLQSIIDGRKRQNAASGQ